MKPGNPYNLNTIIRFVPFLAACLLLGLPSGQSRDEIDRSQRLEMLNRATGGPSADNYFEARMNAILDTSATPERSLVGTEDAAIRAQAAAAQQEKLKKEALLQEAPRAGKDITKVKDTVIRSKADMTEKNYRSEREKLQKANAERLKRLEAPKASFQKEKTASADSKMPLSLKNNPFYRGNFSKSSTEMDYEDLKPVLVSRLVNQNGMDQADAERLVSQSSSAEDLTIQLMEDQGWAYQEASDVTGA